jgi:UDP-N-acetylmuramoyl-tripeptide--D-alanyl-D-alanine ligase
MVGVRAAEVCSRLFTVGERGKMISDAAQKSGRRSLSIQWFASVPEVIEVLKTGLVAGDVVLIKGSHGMRMDRIVTALEAES